jgi:hypothetical protein
MFGFQQTGPAAAAANNTFNRFCYESAMTPEVLEDPAAQEEVRTCALYVGIIPRQVFRSPHPERNVLPRVPVFRGATIELLCRLKSRPLFVAGRQQQLYVLDAQCRFWQCRLKGPPRQIGSIFKFLIGELGTSSRSFAFFPELERFVSSSLCDSSFNIFKLESGSVSYGLSLSQKSSLLSTVNWAGPNHLLTSWHDSSLTLWDLRDLRPYVRPLYRVTPHLTTVVDAEVSAALRLTASVDKSRLCIFTNLFTGQFIRSFRIDGQDAIKKLLLIASGFLAVLSAAEAGGSAVRVFGLDTTEVTQKVFAEEIVEWTKAEFEGGVTCVGCAFRKGRFALLSLPKLTVEAEFSCEQEIVVVHFALSLNAFLVGDESGGIYIVRL